MLVTGGTGFIGRHLVAALVESGHEVHTLSRRPAATHTPAIHHSCDVESEEARDLARSAHALVHLAGQSDASASLADPAFFARVNSTGTLNMLEAARKADALFVLASSQRVYRPAPESLREDGPLDPRDPYGYTKLVAESWVDMYRKIYGLGTVVLRFFSVYGPGQAVGRGASGVVSIFMHRALDGGRIVVNNANLRDFTYVGDVVRGIVLSVERPEAQGGTFNVATGVGTSIGDLAARIKEITGSPSEIEVVGDATDECLVADVERARRAIGYHPEVSLRQGLKLYYDNLRNAGQDSA